MILPFLLYFIKEMAVSAKETFAVFMIVFSCIYVTKHVNVSQLIYMTKWSVSWQNNTCHKKKHEDKYLIFPFWRLNARNITHMYHHMEF